MTKIGAAVLAAALAAGTRAAAQEAGPRALAKGNTRFALALYRDLAARGKDNLFFSPYSISSALAMAFAGAKGKTAEEMARALSLPPAARPDADFAAISAGLNAAGRGGVFKLAVANALWSQAGFSFREDFLSRLDRGFNAALREADFKRDANGAAARINAWVKEKTMGKIESLIPPGALNEATRLVLCNAVYFKGYWEAPFKKRNTSDEDFKLDGGGRARVPLMFESEDFGYAEDGLLQAVELPYKGDRLSMVVLLPKREDRLSALEAALSEEALSGWLAALKTQKVDVYFPRFAARTSFGVKEPLQRLGMSLAFDPKKADFSGMSKDKEEPLVIDAVLHQAYVSVDEQGTEAAAASGVLMMMGAAAEPPHPVFRADHPFVYLIRDRRTGTVLFLGRLTQPS